ASDRLHDWEHNHHYLGANTLSILIYRTAIGTGILIPNFLPVPAISLSTITIEKTYYFNLPFIFLFIPFFHGYSPNSIVHRHSQLILSSLCLYEDDTDWE